MALAGGLEAGEIAGASFDEVSRTHGTLVPDDVRAAARNVFIPVRGAGPADLASLRVPRSTTIALMTLFSGKLERVVVAGMVAIGMLGCGGDGSADGTQAGSSTGGSSTGGSDTASPSEGSTSESTTTSVSSTSSTTTGGAETSSGSGDGSSTPAVCDELGLPSAELQPPGGTDWGEVAGDFSVQTTFGPWRLDEQFSGCDAYIFLNDVGDATSTGLRNTMSQALFARSAPNVHYFFLTSTGDPVAGAEDWQSRVGEALFNLTKEEQELWAERVHFVTDEPLAIDGSVGQFVAAHANQAVFAIDRAQAWDDPGSVSDTETGAFATTAAVLGYSSRYYNFRYDQDQWLTGLSGVTEVPIIDEATFAPDCVVGDECFDTENGPFSNSNNWRVWPVELPDAATMGGFDTMDLVITATCGPSPYSDCGHWDYEAMVNLCSDPECEGPKQEFARWITPYSRPGTRRWVIDATSMLGMVARGGTAYFEFGMVWNMNPSTWDLRLLLRNEGRGEASTEVVPAFAANRSFNETYNDAWTTVEFTPPVDATRVELVAMISGHGQSSGNCAEWCNHQHEFTVNGTDTHLRDFPGQVVAQRCAEAVDEGVVPGQWGNWTPGRAGWCPGLPVSPWVVDITDEVSLGQLNTLDYRGLFEGMPVTEGRGRIRLSSYVVFYQ